MKKFKGCLIKVVGVFAAAFALLLVWAIFSGDSDDVVEVMKENRKESIEEDERKEKTKTPKPSEEDDSINRAKNSDGSFYQYTVTPPEGDAYSVPVPEYIDQYIMDNLTSEEQESLLNSIHLYAGIEDVDELIGEAHPVSIPENANVREIAKEGFIGHAYMFNANMTTITVMDVLICQIQGDDSVGGIELDSSFVNTSKLMDGDSISSIALYAGLNDGVPVFIALNMEIQ